MKSLSVEYRAIRKDFLAVHREIQGNINDKAALRIWAKEHPDKFYELLLKILPKELELGNKDGEPITIKWEK